jgi:hypothetical protein
MSTINRRQVLQGVGGALGAIGLSQLGLERHALRYGRALAQDTRRKVALLVGINAYAARDRLYGPVNDVELQRQLLIHRFGFHSNDIHVLTDAQATRANILGAYNEYLLNSVGPNDVVVMHYSGHGVRVNEERVMRALLDETDQDCIDLANCLNTALVPVDSDGGGGEVKGILGHTLLMMRAALPTENVTLVLDCCYAGGGKRGNVIMRSQVTDLEVRTGTAPPITQAEGEFQQTLLSRLGWSPQQLIEQIESRQGRGFVAASARANQQSADYPFEGFTAGAFTCLLTQHLWHEAQPLSATIAAVASSTTSLTKHSQIPEYDPQGVTRSTQAPIYHVPPVAPAAEAVLLNAGANGTVNLWLGGVNPGSLEAFDQGAEFTQLDAQGNPMATVRLVSRDGLRATGEVIPAAQATSPSTTRGAAPATPLLQEQARGIPANITLRLGLDDTLTAAEQASAPDQVRELSFIEWVAVNPGQAPKPPHVLLGRYTAEIDQRMVQSGVARRPPVGSVGLFSATQEPLMVESFGAPGESLTDALRLRLKPQLTSLLVGRMLALMINQTAWQINVSLTVEHQGSRSGTTTRGGDDSALIVPRLTAQGIQTIPANDPLTITVTNHEAIPLYLGLLAINAAGEVAVLFPSASDTANQDRLDPGVSKSVRLIARPPLGIAQLLVIASPASLQSTLNALRRTASTLRSADTSAQAPDIMQEMFSTLDNRRSGNNSPPPSGPRRLEANAVAALSLLFDIVAPG